jgi:HD superfamily phosphohydrolase
LSLKDEMNNFVEKILSNYTIVKQDNSKIFRDGLGNLLTFEPYEVGVIDSPLIQRLRYIHQTSLTYLIYPSANHTRFEHSLGVNYIVKQIINSLRKNKDTKDSINEEDERTLCLAAILHDVGHGIFSHLSETLIKNLPYVSRELYRGDKFRNAHEMLSYYIVKSDSFNNFLDDLATRYRKPIYKEKIPDMIIGKVEDKEQRFLGNIINGSFDADKLDYNLRDAYFTGIKMTYDLERYLHTISIDYRLGNDKTLVNTLNGTHILEQILFCKMFLYPSIYHHHKLRSIECMVKSIFEKITLNKCSFNKATDFYHFNDYSFLQEARKNKKLKQSIDEILNRKLLMRCLVINNYTIDPKTIGFLVNLTDLRRDKQENIDKVTEIRSAICEKLKENRIILDKSQVWLDLPPIPTFMEPGDYYIKITDKSYEKLSKMFPGGWEESYSLFKWTGNVFGPLKYQSEIAKASEIIIKDKTGVGFNKFAVDLAKHKTSFD